LFDFVTYDGEIDKILSKEISAAS